MITIISGTNRENNLTLKIAKEYQNALTKQEKNSQILDFQDLPRDFIFSALYGKTNAQFNEIIKKYVFDASALVIVSPEYNGSYPGILKAFIDGWDPRKLSNQKVGLIGVASGRQGNSRGMDHLSGVLNYLGLMVVPVLIPISKINTILNEKGNIDDPETTKIINKQINQLVS